ncbi:hypothetical protein TGME49_214830 [Toxoplasma gondii ME49]|uniref:Exportin-T n=1 Tax=Toxoplasma gondii (strain ATCC 50611 / Me49) TaxID=508771 RepID=S8G4D8_TOXGM|nr:hypothetical protein TGME49_214830 [Toxoplasma gondii ME49]EPT26510.1 hypothetical protein TGME49_214830 [Toxoplasma gondii ME49]|eukprot:XP_018635721.1 hypothetical protein TGME49_214830 [Toxoplasma gondii ME49]
MESFEEAVQVVFSQSAHALRSHADRERQERAQAYLDEILSAPDGWAHLLNWLPQLSSVEARFWTLQAFLNVLPSSSPQQRQALREGVLTHCVLRRLQGGDTSCEARGDSGPGASSGLSGAGRNAARTEDGSAQGAETSREDAAVKNKTALLLVRLVQTDFPSTWPTAFLELRRLWTIAVEATSELPVSEKSEQASAKQVDVLDGLDVCLRILLLLHQEVVEDSVVVRDAEQTRRDAEIRTALRQHFSSSELSASDRSAVSFSRLLLQLLQLPVIRQDAALLRLTCEIIGRFIGYMDLLLPPSACEPPTQAQSAAGSLGSTAPAEGETRPTTAVGDGDAETATEGTLVHVLLETWLTCSCDEACNAVVAFAHKKMEAETKARLLSRMGLAEALRACMQQVAQRPELVAGFASMANTTASAFLDSAHTLSQREKEVQALLSEGSRNGISWPQETEAGAQLPQCEKKQTARQQDISRAAAMAWRRVSLLLPVIAELFACPVLDIAFRVEPFLSLFCNKTRLQEPQKGAAVKRKDEVLPSDFSPQALAPFLTNMLQLVYQKVVALQSEEIETEAGGGPGLDEDESEDEETVKMREYMELASQLYKRVFLVYPAHSFSWLQQTIQQVCSRLSLSNSSASSLSATSSLSSSSALSASSAARVWREAGAALHLLLLSAENVKDMPRELKDQSQPLPTCLFTLLQTEALFRFLPALAPPPSVRLLLLSVLGRFAPFFSHHPQFLPVALQLLLGPAFLNLAPETKHGGAQGAARLRRRLACVAGRSCLSLLRFLKSTQPQVSAFSLDILQALQTENCLQIPLPSPARGDAETENHTGAALVPNKLFSVDDQQLLFEAAGVLLGARHTGNQEPRTRSQAAETEGQAPRLSDAGKAAARALTQAERMRLLHQLLQHLIPAFDAAKLSQLSSPEEAACWALLWARTCNAIASLTKSFPSTECRESSGDRTREVWREAFQHISYATQVALSPSSLRPDIGNVFLFSPFFHSFVFLLRRGLQLLNVDILPVMHATLPLLYEALPSAFSASSRALADPERFFVASAFTPGTGAAPCTPQGCGAQLASLVTYFLVTLKEKSLVARGGFLCDDLLRNLFWRHFTLWWRAETESPELLRDQAELQEQLTLLLNTVGKEAPSLLTAFLLAVPVSSSACATAVSSLANGVAVDTGPQTPSLAALRSFRSDSCRESFVGNLRSLQQHLFSVASQPSPMVPAPASYLSLGQGVVASGLEFSDLRNVFLAGLQELFVAASASPPRLREGLDPLHATRVGVSCFLLFSLSPASAGNSSACVYAIQTWLAVVQHVLVENISGAAFPHLQQIQAFLQVHVREKPQDAKAELLRPPPEVQEKAADELLRLLPAREIFAATSALVLHLDVAADAQQARVLGDVCSLWRLFVLGPGGTVTSCSTPSRQNGATSSLFALAAVLSHFFQPIQRLLFSSLADALYGFFTRQKETGAGISTPEKCAEDASQAAAMLVQSLVETADLRTSKENVRQWVLAQRQPR